MKIGAIVQARMGSKRLPGKVMKDIEGKTVLAHVIERIQQSNLIDVIVIATTTHERDDIIEAEALRCGVNIFRGSEEDVLSRYFWAAKQYEIDVVVRITSDCPLIDPKVIDKIVDFHQANKYDIVTNAGSDISNRTFPRGLDTEVFSIQVLENAYKNASEKYQREHVTPYIYENSNNIFYYKNDFDYSKYRWTLDTEDDYILISSIYKHLYKGKHNFYIQDILELFYLNEELFGLNAHVEQKDIK
ncbi:MULTISPECIES: cytidylyltransferase domain-containing protein [Synergistaceae]|uniref:cytidylyltransferase domain-containing protein n=1 Tax=Synergistaceae TaxID=649777 RepID=UPI003AE4046C|nr:glycosyltransferase family protein [Synergistaceae bacterium DZ-S4]